MASAIQWQSAEQLQAFQAYVNEHYESVESVTVPGPFPWGRRQTRKVVGEARVAEDGLVALGEAAEKAATLHASTDGRLEMDAVEGALLLDTIAAYQRLNGNMAPYAQRWQYNGHENPEPDSPLGNSNPFHRQTLVEMLVDAARLVSSREGVLDNNRMA